MRLHHGVSLLAAATLAAASAPAAFAFDSTAPGAGGQPSATLVQPVPASSPDWGLIGVAGGGAITLAGAGLGGSRRRAHRTATPRAAQPSGGS